MLNSRLNSYIMQLSQIFDGGLWLDESYSKKLDNLTDRQVFTKSPFGNHSIAEVVSHLVEWRKEIIRRLETNSSERLLTKESEANWFQLKHLQDIGWHRLYTDLKKTQQEIISLLKDKDDDYLDEPLGKTEFNKEYFVAGLLHHDLYHLGQIGLIFKFLNQ